MLTIYNSLILSQPYYCWAISQNIYINFKNIIFIRIIRIIDKSHRFPHASPLFEKLEILKNHDILHLNQLKFYNKLLNNKLPEYYDSFNMPMQKLYLSQLQH